MNKLFQNKGFRFGLKLGLALFLVAQTISFLSCLISRINLNSTPGISIHSFWDVGFPFSMYYGMTGFGYGDFDLKGFFGNFVFAVIFSLTVGLIFKFKVSARSLLKSRTFIVGFCVGIICFLSLNYYSFISKNSGACFGCLYSIGFPLSFSVATNGFITHKEILWSAIIANIFISLIFSFYIGLIFKFVWEKVAAKRLR